MDLDDISAYGIRIFLFIAGSVLIYPVTVDAFIALSPKPQVIQLFKLHYIVNYQPAALPWIILILAAMFDGIILIALAILFNGLVYTINREEIEYQNKPFLVVDKNSGDQGYYFVKLKRALLIVLVVTIGIIVIVLLSAVISYIERFVPAIALGILSVLLLLAINRVENFAYFKSGITGKVLSILIIIFFLLVCLSTSFSMQ